MALVMILDDLWHGWDGVYAFILALIDLLAAFSTVDHAIILD